MTEEEIHGTSLYNSPERYGLVEVWEYDEAGSYEFDKFIVWFKPKTNEVFWASDSGCSCPSPFEDHKFPSDFGVTPFAVWDPLERALGEWKKDSYSSTNLNVIEAMQNIRNKILFWWLE